MRLKEAVAAAHLSYRELARQIGISKSSIERLVNHGRVPDSVESRALLDRVHAVLASHGVQPPTAVSVKPQTSPESAGATSSALEEMKLMQLNREVLSYFGLTADPFINDIDSDADVFTYKCLKDVSQAIRDTIEERGLLAITGPSGAGKTTVWDGIESEYGFRDDVIICKPAMKDKERLSPSHLTKALIYGITGDEDLYVKSDPEDAGRQLSRALRSLQLGESKKKCILVIDDAHHCNRSVLRTLKTFYEEKVGRTHLMAIVLIGMPELLEKLALIPEIGRRTRIAEMKPVRAQEYIEFKFKRARCPIDRVFSADGMTAFLARYRETPKSQAVGYPLHIQECCIKAMCLRFATSAGPGETITAELMDRLPGGPVRRQTAA